MISLHLNVDSQDVVTSLILGNFSVGPMDDTRGISGLASRRRRILVPG